MVTAVPEPGGLTLRKKASRAVPVAKMLAFSGLESLWFRVLQPDWNQARPRT